ncbi:uncharacterized protein B0P05DRAFT_577450 [Gilbertella persicaria]|uniref:uncharacterized protein n=1 Tax=Gilbertella persicaria TaxID=101096 RepID=UPI0022207F45|nr:uncharacterized protein B0P05DRAFT_577450 [Gilbertella persicaria]KAI8091465.1 hypothetical protein B0P05DRAFT_577450 [Gilbertella persicaria]
MGTTKSRKSRRNNSRPTAFTFLSNIALGNENEKPPDDSIQRLSTYLSPTTADLHFMEEEQAIGASSLHSSDSSFSADEDNLQTTLHSDAHGRLNSSTTPPVITTNEPKRGKYIAPKRYPSESSSEDVQHHKLTREDSERPIASEKIKKKSYHGERDHGHGSLSIMSVFRYYTDKIRNSNKRKESTVNRSYVQQQLESNERKHRKTQSYAHFLNTTGSLVEEQSVQDNAYDPFFLDDDTYGKYGLDPSSLGTLANGVRPSDLKRDMNEQFRLNHPEIPTEITLSKIRAIKLHLLEIGKLVDLEVSSVAHAYVFFEKLVIKNMVTKKNRKLIAACCLFLATKVNEAKGTWFRPLLDAMDDELGVDAEEIHEHEFAVFADLEFNLYVPRREFMPHFERIFHHVESKSIQEYLGQSNFYEINKLH